MKKKILIIFIAIVILLLSYFVGTGYIKNTSAFVESYTLSEDNSEITIKFGVSSSVGSIRDVKIYQQIGDKLYLECINAFGGINGSIGAKDEFTFNLDDDTSIIAVYRDKNCYEEVLVKADDGSWQRANNK